MLAGSNEHGAMHDPNRWSTNKCTGPNDIFGGLLFFWFSRARARVRPLHQFLDPGLGPGKSPETRNQNRKVRMRPQRGWDCMSESSPGTRSTEGSVYPLLVGSP